MTSEEYRGLLGNAIIFYDSAKLLMNNANISVLSGNNQKTVSYFVSSVDYFAFASELCMKSVLQYNEIEYGRTHSLKSLFELYPSDLKDQVYKIFRESFDILPSVFNEKLDLTSSAFPEWRYFVFNNKSITIDNKFLSDFCQVLFNQAGSLIS